MLEKAPISINHRQAIVANGLDFVDFMAPKPRFPRPFALENRLTRVAIDADSIVEMRERDSVLCLFGAPLHGNA